LDDDTAKIVFSRVNDKKFKRLARLSTCCVISSEEPGTPSSVSLHLPTCCKVHEEIEMHSSKGRLVIGLLWHSFRDANLGVGALTLSHLALLKAAASAANRPISIRVFGWKGPMWYPPSDIEVDEVLVDMPTDLLPETPLWRSIADCDVVLDIGTGDVFSDIYRTSFFFTIVCSRIAVLAQHKPLVLAPQTVGPFKDPFLLTLAAQLVRRCARTFTRDSESRSLLQQAGVVEGVEETIDVAFSLPFDPPSRAPGQGIRLGLNVSGLLYQNASTNEFSFGVKVDYPSLIKGIIQSLRQRLDVSIVLVPHVLGDGSNPYVDDVWICKQLADEFGLQIAPPFKSPIEAKSYISGLDLLVGSRMHATIAAISSGVPVIPLAYSRKFSGVFAAVGYPLVCDLLTQDEEQVRCCVEDAVSRLPELRAAVRRSNEVAQSKLDIYRAYLQELMRSLP
jgi:colanic acid/amylovoran biosynthesis protein